MGDVSKILLIILAIFLPPIAVLLARGCSIHLLINIILLIVTFDIGAIIVCVIFVLPACRLPLSSNWPLPVTVSVFTITAHPNPKQQLTRPSIFLSLSSNQFI